MRLFAEDFWKAWQAMYLQHFGLRECPFSTDSDPRYYYPTARHREALACLLYAVEQRRGLALVTGEIGAGKTMLCRAALDRFGPAVEPVFLAHSSLSPLEFLQAVCMETGADGSGGSKVELLHELRKLLAARQQEQAIVVLLVDEAQGLAPEVLEEVRLLTNLETAGGKLLQILLVGQPELRSQIAGGGLRALDQRFAVKFHLGPLARREVSEYVDHRLKVAGAANPADIISEEAKDRVYEASGGIPRLINILCDQALLDAYGRGRDGDTAQSMRRVVDEFEGYYMVDGRAGPNGSEDARRGTEHGTRQPGPQADVAARPPARGVEQPPVSKDVLARIARARRSASDRRTAGATGPGTGSAHRHVRLECPDCGTVIGVCEDQIGSGGRCPGCGPDTGMGGNPEEPRD